MLKNNIQNFFTGCFVWLWNLVCLSEIEGVLEQDAERKIVIWIWGEVTGRWRKLRAIDSNFYEIFLGSNQRAWGRQDVRDEKRMVLVETWFFFYLGDRGVYLRIQPGFNLRRMELRAPLASTVGLITLQIA